MTRIAQLTRRALGVVVLGGAVIGNPASTIEAAPPPKPKTVDCGAGESVNAALTGTGPVTIVVRGTCTENVRVTRDDVTLTTDGAAPATFSAADPAQPAVMVDGARRVLIDGVAPNGISVTGGTNGLSVSRGGTAEIRNCLIQANAGNGLVSSYGSTATVDTCAIQNNTGNGAAAANASSLVVTNSTVSGNTASGLVAARSAYLRVGQDLTGTQVVKAVTISGNGVNGVAVTENSAANLIGGSVTGSGRSGIFIGRGSSGQIGQGSGAIVAGVTVQASGDHGVTVEGANATVVGSTITLNGDAGILVTNAASARIGILNDNSAYAGNSITSNGSNGIHVSVGAGAFIGGNVISGNGTSPAAPLGRFGIDVAGGSATLAGDNTISNNAASGIIVLRGGTALVGDAAFGLPTVNTISGNGAADPNNGGIFAFQGGTIQVRNALITGNTGAAVQAFENGIVELRATTVSSAAAAITAFVGSTVRLRDSSSVVSTGGDGAQLSTLSSLDVRGTEAPASTLQGNGPGAVGVRCFFTSTLSGDLANVSGSAGQSTGCNLFP